MPRFIGSLLMALVTVFLAAGPSEGQNRSKKREQAVAPTQRMAAQEPRSVVGFVGHTGGKLSVTAADGTRYDLEVPPLALVWGTRIEMTVVPRVTGLPNFMQEPRGVRFAPSGLNFARDAWLTITPPRRPNEREAMMLLSKHQAAASAQIELFTEENGQYRMPVAHFSEVWHAMTERDITDSFMASLDDFAADRMKARLWRAFAQYGGSSHAEYQKVLADALLEMEKLQVKPEYESAMIAGASCMQNGTALRATFHFHQFALSLNDSAKQKAYLQLVDRLIGDLVTAGERCVDEAVRDCWVTGDAATPLHLYARGIARRWALASQPGDSDMEAFVSKRNEITKRLLPCLRYQVKISTKQENKHPTAKYGLWHNISVDDEINTNVEAQIVETTGNQRVPGLKGVEYSLVIRGEAEHWPTNYVYDFKDTNTRQTCFTKNAALHAAAGQRMLIEIDGGVVRVSPGNIVLHFWHSTCTIPKVLVSFDELWQNGFLAAYEALRDGPSVQFAVPWASGTGYPMVGYGEFVGTGVNKAGTPELEDLNTTQRTTITIIHKPEGPPPPPLFPTPVRRPLPTAPKGDLRPQ